MSQRLRSLFAFVRYNAGHVFAGKFVYFLLLAVFVFLISVVVHAFEMEIPPGPEDIYFFLLAPGILLVFYPSSHSVQTDVDHLTRLVDDLFPPDYFGNPLTHVFPSLKKDKDGNPLSAE